MAKVVLALGDDVSAEMLYPASGTTIVSPLEMRDILVAADREVGSKLREGKFAKGSVIVAGENFGIGAVSEQAVTVLGTMELIVVARSFSRAFLCNAVNVGLHVVHVPGVNALESQRLKIGETTVKNESTGESFPVKNLPASFTPVLEAGGLTSYTRRLMQARRGLT